MDVTNRAPNVPVSKFKRTKIIVTLGPATNSYRAVLALMKAGANGFRINFSHVSYEDAEQQIKWIRKASKEYSKPAAIIQDLHGPKVQLGDFDGIIPVLPGQEYTFGYKGDHEQTGHIPVQFDMAKRVKRGERLLLADGRIRMNITSVRDGVVSARAENEGVLTKKKGINLPDSDFEGEIITKKDKEDLAFGSTQDFDYVALSFIQTPHDVRAFRTILKRLGSKAKIISKVETAAATQNLEEIVEESDAVMVARGDLATDVKPEVVPIIQRKIVSLGLKYGKPTIVATQMMVSMTDNPSPTRAEVSDVATAVIIGADAVMLSEETAIGKYPIEAVETMKRVILYVQEHNPVQVTFEDEKAIKSRQDAISQAVMQLAHAVSAVAIVAETKTGETALQVVAHRPRIPIIAVTTDPHVSQQLAIAYGTKAYTRPADKYAATKLTNWLHQSKVLKKGDVVLTVSGKYPGVVGTTDTIKVRAL